MGIRVSFLHIQTSAFDINGNDNGGGGVGAPWKSRTRLVQAWQTLNETVQPELFTEYSVEWFCDLLCQKWRFPWLTGRGLRGAAAWNDTVGWRSLNAISSCCLNRICEAAHRDDSGVHSKSAKQLLPFRSPCFAGAHPRSGVRGPRVLPHCRRILFNN